MASAVVECCEWGPVIWGGVCDVEVVYAHLLVINTCLVKDRALISIRVDRHLRLWNLDVSGISGPVQCDYVATGHGDILRRGCNRNGEVFHYGFRPYVCVDHLSIRLLEL